MNGIGAVLEHSRAADGKGSPWLWRWLLTFVTVAAVGALAPGDPTVADDIDDDLKPLVLEPEAIPAVVYFDSLIFGRSDAAATHQELNRYLREKIVETELVCGLTQSQREKLRLAGKGDIKRLLDRVEVSRKKLRDANPDQADVVLQELRADADMLREAVRSDPFAKGSFFGKTWSRTLTPQQAARCAAFAASERLTGVRLQAQPRGDDRIEEIRFPTMSFGDNDLKRVAGLKTLQRLVLASTPVTDAGLVHLAGLADLRELDLGDTRIEGAGLVHLRELSSLRVLDLRRTPVHGGNLVHLRGLTNLRQLHLQQTFIDDAGLAPLADLIGLEELYLRHTRITDAGMAHLRDLIHVKQLDLDGTRITDAGLAHLSGMSKLETLDLQGTHVTDTGIARLAKLPSLRHVYLFDTPVTDAGIESLQQFLPRAKLMR